MALLAGEVWLLMGVHTGRRSARWLWVLPPLLAVWINLHGGWVEGLVMLAVLTGVVRLMDLRRRWCKDAPTSQIPWPRLVMVLGACGLALLINPYGWRLVTFPLTMEASWIRGRVYEWQTPVGNSAGWRQGVAGVLFWLEPLFWVYLILLLSALWRAKARHDIRGLCHSR